MFIGGFPLATVFSSQFRGVLDQLSVASAAAYGLRRLRAGYAGPAINVRRSSDNAAIDVGFLFNGSLDTGSLLAFCGSGSGYVTTWYDQSSNGRHATQTTATQQPKIVNAGALMTAGGRPTIQFDGASAYLVANFSTLNQPNTINVVHKVDTISSPHHITDGASSPRELIGIATATQYGQFAGSSANVSGLQNSIPAIVTVLFNNTSSYFAVNGAVTSTSVGTQGLGSQLIGAGNGGNALYGSIAEYVLLNAVLPTSDRQTLERNQGSYHGITVQ